MAAVMAAIVDVEVVVRLVGTLVLAEPDIAVDAGEVPVCLPCRLEVGVKPQQAGLESFQQAAKCSHNMQLVTRAVLVKPRLVVMLGEFLEKLKRSRWESLKSNCHRLPLGKDLQTQQPIIGLKVVFLSQ
jgi:hypothetical protein